MFSKILYPTDFSGVSLKAFDYVKKLKEAGAEEVILLSVIENITLEESMEICEFKSNGDYEACIENIEEKVEKETEERLKALGEQLDIPFRIEVKTGKPFKKIVETAKEYDVKLIVMGSHGRGEIEELLIGSVTENVIRHTHLPVLVVR